MPKVILTTHQKGGVGKSTLTFNMANALKDSVRVAIIDLDLQGSIYKSRSNSDIEVYSSAELRKIQNLDFDFIFIDTPPYLAKKTAELCLIADCIVIPTKTGFYDLLAIEETINIIKQVGKENKALIVLNMVKPNSTLSAEMLEALENYSVPVAKTPISDLVAYTRSALNGGLNDEKAEKQMESLTMEVLKILQK